MSNLKSAKDAITAELSQAKQGLAHYQARVEALEKTLAQLAAVNATSETATTETTEAAVPIAKPVAKKAKTPEAKGGANDLPFTGGDYWTNLLSDKPKSSSEIFQAAIDKLGFIPSKDQVKKLFGRMTFALNTLVNTKKIQDSGSGRERRFFKG